MNLHFGILRPSVTLVLVAALLYGCAPSPAVKVSGKSISPREIKEAVRANHEAVRSMSGSGTISVETPEMAQSGSFDLQLRKPDSVLVTVEGPFGINVGSVLLTRTSFTFYNSLENQLVSGVVTPGNLRRIFRMEMTFDDLLTLFSGGTFLREDNGDPASITEEENQLVFVYRSEDGERRYFVDPATLLITRVQRLDSGGKPTLEARFERYRVIGDAHLPGLVRLTQQVARRRVSVSFSSLQVNADVPPLVLDVPANAERIRWKE